MWPADCPQHDGGDGTTAGNHAKKKTFRSPKRDTEEIVAERKAFEEWLSEVDPARVKVVDEMGMVRGMRLGYGYAPRGERVHDVAPVGRGKRLNVLGWMGLDGDGMLAGWKGSVNTEVFNHFIEKYLFPSLKKGDYVVWDNASFHRDERLLCKLKSRGVKLVRLPRYSPDYTPIEMLWQKLKHYIKKARIDKFGELEDGLMEAIEKIESTDVQGWFRHCGFNVSTI